MQSTGFVGTHLTTIQELGTHVFGLMLGKGILLFSATKMHSSGPVHCHYETWEVHLRHETSSNNILIPKAVLGMQLCVMY